MFDTASAFVVRPSRPEDVPAITAIYAHHVRHGLGSFEEEPPDPAEMARRRADVLARGLPYLVARRIEDGTVLGYAYAGPYRPRAAYRFTVEDSVYLAPECGRQGLGRALVSRLVADCAAAGYSQMMAVIGDSANAGSIGLHRALGFRLVGTLDGVGFKFGRWVDSVLMQRELAPREPTA